MRDWTSCVFSNSTARKQFDRNGKIWKCTRINVRAEITIREKGAAVGTCFARQKQLNRLTSLERLPKRAPSNTSVLPATLQAEVTPGFKSLPPQVRSKGERRRDVRDSGAAQTEQTSPRRGCKVTRVGLTGTQAVTAERGPQLLGGRF